MFFSTIGVFLGISMAIIQKVGGWLFDIDDHELISMFPLLMYQAVGGFVGGLIASLAGLSLLSSLIYSLIFVRYFEQVGFIFSSEPSQYVFFVLLVLVLIFLLRFFVIGMKNIFQIDFGKDSLVSVTVMTIVGIFIFILLHYFFLETLWRSFINNLMLF